MNISSTAATLQTCSICNAPLSFNRARIGQLCGRRECDWRYSLLRQQNRVCTVCGRPLSEGESANRVCAAPACRRAAVGDIARRVSERNQARWEALIRQEIEQAGQLHDRVMNTFDLREPGSFPLVVIPAFTSRIVNLPERRRRAFRDHLTNLIAQVALPSEIPPSDEEGVVASLPDATPEAQAAMGMACSCCKGLCCESGADHAYLKVETIRRYRAEHPDQRPRDVLEAYLGRVGHRTYERSCIFHQSEGCALSRDMRADLCNRHYCKALKEFQQDLPASGGPVRAFFVSAHYGVVQTAALVHENQMLTVPVSSTTI